MEKPFRGIPWFFLMGALFVWSPTFGTTEPTVFAQLGSQSFWIKMSQGAIAAAFVVSALGLAAFGERALEGPARGKTVVVASGVIAAGMFLGSLPALGAPAWILPFGSVLRGLPFCFVIAAWLSALAALDGRSAGIALFGALALYAALGLAVPALAARSTAAGACAMCALPLASGWGCLHAGKCAPVRKTPAKTGKSALSSRALYAAINVTYGFAYGVMLYNFSRLGNAALYASFGVFSLVGALLFALYHPTRDMGFTFRVCITTAPLLLLVAALSRQEGAIAMAESGVWAVTIFFTIIICTDSDFTSSKSPWRSAGTTLALAGVGILVGLAAMGLGPDPAMAGLPLMTATLAAMLTLSAMFLPNGITEVNRWGFSSFMKHESRETFLERRCAELTARCQLTPRELDVLRLLVQDCTNEQVSEALVISPLTAKTHVRNIYAKLDVHDRGELMDLVEHGEGQA